MKKIFYTLLVLLLLAVVLGAIFCKSIIFSAFKSNPSDRSRSEGLVVANKKSLKGLSRNRLTDKLGEPANKHFWLMVKQSSSGDNVVAIQINASRLSNEGGSSDPDDAELQELTGADYGAILERAKATLSDKSPEQIRSGLNKICSVFPSLEFAEHWFYPTKPQSPFGIYVIFKDDAVSSVTYAD